MIPLTLGSATEAVLPFVARLRRSAETCQDPADARLVGWNDEDLAFAGRDGMFSIANTAIDDVDGDVVLIDPLRGAADRILRSGSKHNTLLVTERCDQLCVMCSQPPKKTHVDRFRYFSEACVLAEPDAVIGISGGEPTLYKPELLNLVENTLAARPDLRFHILTNGQHFDEPDIERLRLPTYAKVTWGIPLYASEAGLHDAIVGKVGAFERLEGSLAVLLTAGARIELRTVVLQTNVFQLHDLARHVANRLGFVESWSIMQLENIGFARNRWDHLFFDHVADFSPIERALDYAALYGLNARLFNFPKCTIPKQYRHLAPASISDWKRKYAPACEPCREKANCSGFFEWHPSAGLMEQVRPL